MKENTVVPLRQPDEIDDPLTEILRCGAKRLVQQAVEAEFAAFLAKHADLGLPDGRQRVVRHGHHPARPIQTGIGRSRCRSRRRAIVGRRGQTSASAIRRRSCRNGLGGPEPRQSLPALYLRGVSTGDFQDVLTALLARMRPIFAFGDRAAEERLGGRLSALASQRSVGATLCLCLGRRHLQARMEPQAECILVLIGAIPEGKKRSFWACRRACGKAARAGRNCLSI